jgi:hypothetical protein
LGPVARGNNAGFQFVKVLKDTKAWVAEISDFVEYYAGSEKITEEDVDEEYIQACFLLVINKGAEETPGSPGHGAAGGGFGG